jgi:hypothetical protein
MTPFPLPSMTATPTMVRPSSAEVTIPLTFTDDCAKAETPVKTDSKTVTNSLLKFVISIFYKYFSKKVGKDTDYNLFYQ